MKLKLAAPTIHTPGFLAFCDKVPDYIDTLKRIEQRGAAIFTAQEAALITEMLVHFTPLPPIAMVPSDDDMAAIKDAQDAARQVIRECSPYQLGEALQAITPALQALLVAQLPGATG